MLAVQKDEEAPLCVAKVKDRAASFRINRSWSEFTAPGHYHHKVFEVSAEDRRAMGRAASCDAAPRSEVDNAGSVVLEATRRGREELERARFGLGGNQRRLLMQLDGLRSLDECATAEPRLQTQRLGSDAARLVAFGLARQVRGELPQDMLVAAMNLTARIALDQLPPLEPERTVTPTLAPRVAPSPNRRSPLRDEPPLTPEHRRRWPLVVLIAALSAAIAAIAFLT